MRRLRPHRFRHGLPNRITRPRLLNRSSGETARDEWTRCYPRQKLTLHPRHSAKLINPGHSAPLRLRRNLRMPLRQFNQLATQPRAPVWRRVL